MVVAVVGAAVVAGPAVVVAVAGAAVVVARPEGNWHDRENMICVSSCASKVQLACSAHSHPSLVSRVTNP